MPEVGRSGDFVATGRDWPVVTRGGFRDGDLLVRTVYCDGLSDEGPP